MSGNVVKRAWLLRVSSAVMLYLGAAPLYVLTGAGLLGARGGTVTLLPLFSLALACGAGFARGRGRKPLFAVAVVLAAAAHAVLLLPSGPAATAFFLPSLLMMLYYMPATSRAPGEEWRPSLVGVGVGLHVAGLICAKTDAFQSAGTLLGWLFSAYLLMCVFYVNRMSVSDSAGKGTVNGLIAYNRRLLSFFCIAAIPIANLDVVAASVKAAALWLVRAAFDVMKFIAGLLTVTSSQTSDEAAGGGALQLGEEVSEPSAFAQIMEKIVTVAAIVGLVIVAVWLICKIAKKMRVWLRKLWERMQWYSRRIGEGYEDRSETLFDWSEVGRSMKERWKQYARRVAPPAWGRLNAREKVRRVYALLLTKNGDVTPATTAREALAGGELGLDPAAARTLADLYDEARYSDHAITEEKAREMRKAAGV